MIATRGLGRKATAGGPVATFGLGLVNALLERSLRIGYRILAERVVHIARDRTAMVATGARWFPLGADRAAAVAAGRQVASPGVPLLYRLAGERSSCIPAQRVAAVPSALRWYLLQPERRAVASTDRT